MPRTASVRASCGEMATTGTRMTAATGASWTSSPPASRATASRAVNMPRGLSASTTTTPPTPMRTMRSSTARSISPGPAVTTARAMALATVRPHNSSSPAHSRAT